MKDATKDATKDDSNSDPARSEASAGAQRLDQLLIQLVGVIERLESEQQAARDAQRIPDDVPRFTTES